MNKNLKIFFGISYILILLVFLYFIFSYIEISRLNDFLYYKELQTNLQKITSQSLFLNLLIFFLFCLVWVSLLGFGSPLLIVSGILFGDVDDDVECAMAAVNRITDQALAHKLVAIQILHNLFEWHDAVGAKCIRNAESDQAKGWLKDAGKFQAIMNILQTISVDDDDFTVVRR